MGFKMETKPRRITVMSVDHKILQEQHWVIILANAKCRTQVSIMDICREKYKYTKSNKFKWMHIIVLKMDILTKNSRLD